MKIHHLNCCTMCPKPSRLVTGSAGKLVCHCLLIETNDGLALVDTGFGVEDVLHPKERLSKTVGLIGPQFNLRDTAREQVKALGFKVSDVRHILPTHLDMDHAGGLGDFPEAKVHLYRSEFECATQAKQSYLSRHRYRPIHWAHHPKWELYDDTQGESWMGFGAVRNLRGLPPEILLVPLVGHTLGHCGIAVQTEKGWMLHAGDAYFYHEEMHEPPRCTQVLSAFQKLLAMDNNARISNQKRLRDLANQKNEKVEVFCAHDSTEFEKTKYVS